MCITIVYICVTASLIDFCCYMPILVLLLQCLSYLFVGSLIIHQSPVHVGWGFTSRSSQMYEKWKNCLFVLCPSQKATLGELCLVMTSQTYAFFCKFHFSLFRSHNISPTSCLFGRVLISITFFVICIEAVHSILWRSDKNIILIFCVVLVLVILRLKMKIMVPIIYHINCYRW